MTDFYKMKKDAYQYITELYGKKVTVNAIIYKVGSQYGFSKKFVMERIEQIEQLTEAELKKGVK